jgi:N-acyl-D-aspartate/D-glutamate deacylase
LLGACASAQEPAQVAATLDVVIAGGTVYDGTGAPGRKADVGVRGNRVVAIGDLSAARAKRRIDASGKYVCPGFIDLHNHSDSGILRKGLRENLCYLTQGCTTIVTGNCGGGKIDVDRYFGRLTSKGMGTNVAHLLPQGSIRSRAMGGSVHRAPTAKETAKIEQLFARGMKHGAFGMSTGLIYTPGSFASTDELVACARVVAAAGGIYASHIRDEGDELLKAVREAIEIGRASGCSVHISHFKASQPPNWGKVADSCALVEKARTAGQRVTCDQYPYHASSTSLAALVIPTWAREGSNTDLLRRIDDAVTGKKIRAAIKKAFARRGGYDKILIANYRKQPAWNGLTIGAAAEKAALDPVELVCRMQQVGRVQAVAFSMSIADVEFVMKKRFVATASDGSTQQKSATRPHPRSYGTFPRKIGHYAIEKGVLPVAQAIYSSSGLPAEILGLTDRGYLRVGVYADVVVFDPASFRDRATFADPHQFSTGVVALLVNGQLAIDDSKPTHALAGCVLRRGN